MSTRPEILQETRFNIQARYNFEEDRIELNFEEAPADPEMRKLLAEALGVAKAVLVEHYYS